MARFLQAANYTPAKRTPHDIWYLVVHDEETPFRGQEAWLIATFFANQPKNDNGTSAHRVVDNTEIIHSVRVKDIAWAAPGANMNGIHWEQSGYAADQKATWKDDYGLAQMELLAADIASEADRCNIPIVRLTPRQIAENYHAGRGIHRGICGHADITAANISPSGTHTDPGPNYPWRHLLTRIKHYS